MRLFPLLLVVGSFAPTAYAGSVGEALIEISIRASLQVSTEMALRGSTDETSEDDDDRVTLRSTLSPDVAAALIAEAHALDGPLLREVADDLELDPMSLALAIVASVPEHPTRDELGRILSLSAPSLLALQAMAPAPRS